MPVPFAQKTLAQIRQQIGYLMLSRGKFQAGTASAGAAGSITLPFAQRYPTDFFVGRQIYIYAGTGAGQARFCTASVISTGVCSVSPNWTVTPDNTSKVEVWSGDMIPDEVNAAINRAIDVAATMYPLYVESTAATIDASRQVITLPGTFTHFSGVYYVPNLTPPTPTYYLPTDDQFDNMVQQPFYKLVGNKVYVFPKVPSDATSFTVMGYRLPAQLVNDTDNAELPADYLVYMAASDLEASEMGGPQEDPEQHGSRGEAWFRKAQGALTRISTSWVPNTELVLA